MKKLFFLSALLCASVMANATADYCDAAIKSDKERDAIVTMRWIGGTTYEFSITTADNIVSFNAVGSNFYADKDGVGGYQISRHLSQDGNTLSVQFTSTSKPRIYANNLYIVLNYNDNNIENRFDIPMDANWAACGDVKDDPELSLNQTAVTLSAETPAETFQIEPTKASGAGAISYESDKPGIASVSESGLVTAVGRGTATITVTSAETSTHTLGVQTLAVTVTGPINWDGLDWLYGSDKYKLVTEPEISDGFGGKSIVDGTTLRICFPSAVWGDNSSITHTTSGAAGLFPLSQFKKIHNEFNFSCDGTTYRILLYYKDGNDTPTAIDNTNVDTKARKVLENGQLIIIKNGVRYNALGAQL